LRRLALDRNRGPHDQQTLMFIPCLFWFWHIHRPIF